MKVALIFYSFSGNTQRVFEYLKEVLLSRGCSLGFLRLKPENEPKSFFKQGFSAFTKEKPKLKGEVFYDLKDFDYIILGTPLWAFTFSPALRSYLEKVKNLKNKRVSFLFTYGSGAGLSKAIRELKSILEEKSAQIKSFASLEGKKVKERSYLEEKLKDFLRL
ncbi:MAG: flavodoxin family protein [Candidatus Omnitrophica bacterium]|nr:flavodoxin family protein [Candidatus Omnitrophota bacterium]